MFNFVFYRYRFCNKSLEDGPSEKAGLLTGDRILIADQDTLYQKKLTSEQIVSRLKGNSTTPVHLTIYRRKLDSIIEFDIEEVQYHFQVSMLLI